MTSEEKALGLARKAVEKMAAACQEKRDLEEVVAQLREKLTETERTRDEAVDRAQEIIGQRDEQLRQLKGWCERWYRGDLGSLEVLAAIAKTMDGSVYTDSSVLERRKAVQEAQTQAYVISMTNQLSAIDQLLSDEGVQRITTHVRQVQAYIELMRGVEASAQSNSA